MFVRKLNFAIAIVLISSVLPVIAASKPIPGKPCQKLGSSQIFNGAKYTCIKSGKKIVWSKPSKITVQPSPTTASSEKPTPAPTPTILPTTPTPKPSQSPTPTFLDATVAQQGKPCKINDEESFPLSGPLRCSSNVWQLINKDQDSIASRAFRSLLEKYNQNPKGVVDIKFYEDPASPAAATLLRLSMEAAARLWNVKDLPKQPYPVLVGHSLDWLKKTANENGLIPNNGWTNIENQYKDWGGCSYAEFYSRTGQPWYVFCYSNDGEITNKDIGFLQVGAHEYTHVIQFHLANNFYRDNGDPLPPWFQEGYATYVGTMLGSATQVNNSLRKQLIDQLQGVKTPLSDYKYSFPARWNDVYPLGGFAIEALVAVKGIDSMEKILKALASGKKTEQAVIEGTGKSLDFWTEIGQGYVNSLIKGKAWTLEELQSKF